MIKGHSVTREHLIRTDGGSESYDPKWGRFKPTERFNVDQTPMSFAVDVKRTYEVSEPRQKHSKTWISQPGSGLEKRQCTIPGCSRADGKQPKIAIIFRGKGECVRHDEKDAWHPDIDVYCQDNVWADTAFSVDWVNRTLASAAEDIDHFILFVDNLTAQETDAFSCCPSRSRLVLQMQLICGK